MSTIEELAKMFEYIYSNEINNLIKHITINKSVSNYEYGCLFIIAEQCDRVKIMQYLIKKCKMDLNNTYGRFHFSLASVASRYEHLQLKTITYKITLGIYNQINKHLLKILL
jgi:hypothetical protein